MNSSATFGTMAQTCAVDLFSQSTKEFLSLFYIMDIKESIKDSVDDVPNFEIVVSPFLRMFSQTVFGAQEPLSAAFSILLASYSSRTSGSLLSTQKFNSFRRWRNQRRLGANLFFNQVSRCNFLTSSQWAFALQNLSVRSGHPSIRPPLHASPNRGLASAQCVDMVIVVALG